MIHPLLKKIDIIHLKNIDDICQKIENLGLLTKKHGNLIIVKYPNGLKYSEDEYINKSRGLIIDGNTKKIINYSIEGSLSPESFFKKVEWKNIDIERCLEGTLLNLFYYNGSWCLSTKFSVNADESKYKSNKTFRQLFDEIVDINRLNLTEEDRKYCFSLLLRHKENKIVEDIKENCIYHLETTNVITGEKCYNDIGLEHMEVLQYSSIPYEQTFKNLDSLYKYVQQLNYWEPGVMLYSNDRKYRCKIDNPKYNYIKSLLNGQRDIRYIAIDTILGIYRNGDMQKWHDISQYYPEYIEILADCNLDLHDMINNIHTLYLNKKVHKLEDVNVGKYNKIIGRLHDRYHEGKSQDKYYKITRSIVKELLSKQDTAYIYTLLYKLE